MLVISVGANIFFDASREELAVADAVLAVTVGASPTTDNDHHHRAGTLSVLAVRTIDPPSRLSAPAAEMGMVTGNEGEKEGGWKPRKGGVKRGVLRRMLESCVERGGVGEEVLGGLERFA